VKSKLQGKHPSSSDSELNPPTGISAPSIAITTDDIIEAAASLDPGSAAGAGGLLHSHLQLLACYDDACEQLRMLVHGILNNALPPAAIESLTLAVLVPLAKQEGNGSTGVRPIAVGDTLRRLAGKVGLREMHSELVSTLEPLQLGLSRGALKR